MAKPRRILILNERDPTHPRAGGAEIHVEEIFSRLARRGHIVHQYSTRARGAAAKDHQKGIQLERVGPLALYYMSVPARLMRARRSDEFDVVVECLNKIPFYAPLFTDRPVLALCHHLFGEVAFSQVQAPIAAAVWIAERGLPFCYRHCEFVAISESSRADLVARGVDRDRIAVSHPGITRPERGVDLDAPRPRRIAYLGRLEAYKRVDLMLKAAARLIDRFPDLEIAVLGRGPERERLERLAQSLGLGTRTRFHGFVSDAERDAILVETRVCVFPSQKEGWGLTVIEANALGAPVVASDAAGLRDSVRNEQTGLLVAPGDIDGFAAAIARLLEDSTFAHATRAEALAWSRGFEWERAASDMEAAIEKAIVGART
jgi:glycosyltransferase involved in cell wall biosynthesis